MLSDSYRLKKQLGIMYFEIVLFAPLRCINDISLMNFPIFPRGDLYMLQFQVLSRSGSFLSQTLMPSVIVSVLFFLSADIRQR